MAYASFAGIRAKLARANVHAETFDRVFAEFLERDPYTIVPHFDADPPHAVHLHWKVKETQPVDLALIFGDLLTNLRATLDYLVWQLVLAAGNTPTERTAFPCVRQATGWNAARRDRLAGVDHHSIAEIEKLQPYHRAQQPERHLLAVLQSINNFNKHRALSPVVTTAPTWTVELSADDLGGRNITFDQWLNRPIEDDIEFACYSFSPPLDKHQIQFETKPAFRVAFSDGLDHSDGWTYSNADLIAWVEAAVAIFEPALPS